MRERGRERVRERGREGEREIDGVYIRDKNTLLSAILKTATTQ